MRIGYARVSTADQNLDVQRDALQAAGCERIVEDVGSGAARERPGLEQLMGMLRPGDVVVCWKLDRIGRSLGHLVELVTDLERREVGFTVLTGGIDTTSSSGRLVFHLFAAIAEFERELIRERTMAGLTSARARGRVGGRPAKMTPAKVKQAAAMMADPGAVASEVAATLGVSTSTLYRWVDGEGRVRATNG
jgi:DNA invertase Pin-like site-specific DNA recombinase